MSTQTLDPDVLGTAPEAAALPGRLLREGAGGRRIPGPRPLSPTPTYVGVAVVALGFAVLAVAWVQVARETNVAYQLPYLVSGGLVGLCIVLVGLTVIDVAARRRDAALREKQTELLADALVELRSVLEDGADQR